jgi:hypothetical protein
MIEIYCEGVHDQRAGLCAGCHRLYEYACRKIDRCPHGRVKPVCAVCVIHCYSAEERDRIRAVMRFSGPRMLVRHPFLAFLHVLDGLRPAPGAGARGKRSAQP